MKKEKHPNLKKWFNYLISTLKVVFYILLFSTIVFLIGLVIYQLYNFASCLCDTRNQGSNINENIERIIKDIATLLTCITASVSLLIASLVRRETIQNRKKERELEINQRWYNELIINRHLNKSLSFFDNCINTVDKLKELNVKKENLTFADYEVQCKNEIVFPFTEEYTSVQYGLVSDLQIIDMEISENIKELFEKFQDDFINEIDRKTPDYSMMKSYIYNTRQGLLNKLKQFDLCNINS